MKKRTSAKHMAAAAAFVLLAAFVVLRVHSPVWARLHVLGFNTGPRIMALTYDDGPDPVNTPAILELLDRYDAKATFFMVGRNAQQYPELAREVVDRGHAVGNHTWSHPHDVRTLSDTAFLLELQRGAQAVRAATGRSTTLFRPPRGRVDTRITALAAGQDFRTIMWHIAADKRALGTPQKMAAHVRRYAAPGAVILLHDGAGPQRGRDIAATRLILDDLTSRGYRFVTLPELIAHFPRTAR
jgi:peptidoglycan/xylan/chitin deacetylase (PgdA/CDA1 family)